LNLLEGEPVAISLPKNNHATDVEWNEDTPIFATAASPIHRVIEGTVIEDETEMINKRWCLFHFKHQIPKSQVVEQKPCGRCFAELVLDC
jgi:hypothetical protein